LRQGSAGLRWIFIGAAMKLVCQDVALAHFQYTYPQAFPREDCPPGSGA